MDYIYDFCTYCDELHLAFCHIYNDLDGWHVCCSNCHSDILDFIESLNPVF